MKRSELITLLVVLALTFGASQWLRSPQTPGTPEQAAELRRLLGTAELEMISSTTCRYCTSARQWLTEHRVPFRECFIEKDAACMSRYAQTGARATPTFVVGGNTVVLGLDLPRITERLQAQ